MTSKTTNKLSPEVRERTVRMGLDHERDYPHAQGGVEVRQGLVEQQDLRLPDDDASDGGPLALAARKGPGVAIQEVGHMEDVCGGRHPPVDLGLVRLGQGQPRAFLPL